MSHEHLSDEHLSAYLDSAAPDRPSPAAADAAAIATCASCRQRLDAIEDARALVRRPVAPVAPSARAEAVRAALSGVRTPDWADHGPSATATTTAATTTATTTTTTTNGNGGGIGTASVAPMASARGDRRPPRAPLTAVAAAVVALALAAGIPIALSHHGSTAASTAAKTVHAAPRVPASATTSEPTATAASSVLDLGQVRSPTALRSQLAPILKSRRAGPEFGASSLVAPPQTQSDSAAPSPVPSAGIPAPFASCVATAHQEAGSGHTVAVVATLTYRGTAALAVVVAVTGPTTTSSTTTRYLALVVARSDCRTLARTTF